MSDYPDKNNDQNQKQGNDQQINEGREHGGYGRGWADIGDHNQQPPEALPDEIDSNDNGKDK